jgi:hypothetical protein
MQYQFHMTLTGKTPARRRKAVLVILLKMFRRSAIEPSVAIDRIVLVKQETPSARFRVVSTASHTGGRAISTWPAWTACPRTKARWCPQRRFDWSKVVDTSFLSDDLKSKK